MQFVDLKTQFQRVEKDLRAAFDEVFAHNQFIMGPEVAACEKSLADFCGARHVLSCASGSDALLMALMAWRVGPGDAVIAPAYTFVATAEMVQLLGARVIFADVEADTFLLDPQQLESCIARAKKQRCKLRGVIAVDLFGLPADYDAIEPLARAHDLFVLADSAQSFGARRGARQVGLFGDAGTTSFFPAKPLGCYGDGGAVFTEDAEFAALIESIRIHGQGAHAYDNVRTGITGRLDTLQAAVLNCKLKIFPSELRARRRIATTYTAELERAVTTPRLPPDCESSWAQYTIRAKNRDAIRRHLQDNDIPNAIYYPAPLHKQPAFQDADAKNLPVAEKLCDEVLSLPMHAYLSERDQARVIDAVKAAARS